MTKQILKTVYHASPYCFDKFEIPWNGLHFGTKESAFLAVEYKNVESFYLYEVVINISDCEDAFDQGMEWRDFLDNDKSKVYSYTNKYEPSTDKSYVMFDTKFIVKICNRIYIEY